MTTTDKREDVAAGDMDNSVELRDSKQVDDQDTTEKNIRKQPRQSHGVKQARSYQAMASSYAVRQK